MSNPRKAAVKALLKVENDAAYSNIALNAVLRESGLENADRAFVSAVFYGVLDRRITIDYILSRFIKTPLKKVAPFTLEVLRSAVYQIMFMDKVPDSAAVNEAVKLIKSSKESRNAGFANAVLRNILRNEITLPKGNDAYSLSVRYSCPEWIIKSFITDYGAETAEELLKESLKPAPVVIRVNTLKTDTKTLKAELEKCGIPSDTAEKENALILKKGIDAAEFDLYKKGFFYAEDLSSQTAVSVLNPKKGERVLDMCAAPGGKSFTMALLMENAGEIISCDLYEQRVGLIKSGAERLGIDIIKPMTADACVYNMDLGEFDCILCDVPCSGLGVLRRKPDIKYKPESDFTELKILQYKILENAARYLKKGGRILYSTCTLRREENEKLVNSFIMEYNGFHKMYEHTYLPHIDKTDGFYCALIVKE